LQSSNPFQNAKMTNEDCRQIAAETRQKLRVFSVNSKIIEQMLTKFVHNVARLLPYNLFKADLRSANQLSNARATTKRHFWCHLQTSPKFNWLPWQRPFGEHEMNIGIIIPTNTTTKDVK